VNDLQKYSSNPQLSEATAACWAAIRLLAAGAAKAGATVDAASLQTALDGLHGFEPGIVPPISYDQPAPTNPFGPRMFTPYILPEQYMNGRWQPTQDTFVDIATGQPAA
jgi:hypothetical protein